MARTALLAVLALWWAGAQAAGDWQGNRLTAPAKVTVGPADNSGAAVGPQGRWLYFSRVRTRVPEVFRQDLASQRTQRLLRSDGDSRSPAVAPGGGTVAVVSFRHDARGDICLVRDRSLECLTEPGAFERSPFWVDAGRLGWLERPRVGMPWRLVVRDLASGRGRILAQGSLSAPTASPDGRYIVYQRGAAAAGGLARLKVYDLREDRGRVPQPFALPGITGSMAFSRDGEHLYFTHYLNDTSLDQIIDGSDHGVLFRIPFERLLAADEPPLPEQLTSLGRNCRFPALSADHLYVTCAFERSLDIYRLPLSGAVPSPWDRAKTEAAYRAARSYADRLLLLNVLHYRHGREGTAVLERLLSHHLEIGELRAAGYYVERLRRLHAAAGRERLAGFYTALGPFLEVRAAEKRQPPDTVTAGFRERVAAARSRLARVPADLDHQALVAAYLDAALGRPQAALERLAAFPLDRPDAVPLARYLQFELFRRLLDERDPERLLALYPAMFGAPGLSPEARLYYAFHYLRRLGRQRPDPAARIAALRALLEKSGSPPAVRALLEAEIGALELAAAGDDEARKKAYLRLKEQLAARKGDPLPRRVQHVRALQVLGEAGDLRYMELISRHWLLTTHVSEMEFPHVAEQYAVSVMDQAYGLLARDEPAEAWPSFYSVLRQTNDLEAHYHYVTLGLGPLGLEERVNGSYELLRERDLLGRAGRYVEALRRLLPDGKDGVTGEDLDRAVALLEGMEVAGTSPAMTELLLGYAYHRKLLRGEGPGYDKELFQRAHRHYMMALDLGYRSTRVRAATLENLARLHFRADNFAIAAELGAERARLPFASPEDAAAHRWHLARSLFYVDRPDAAREQAERALAIARKRPGLPEAAFREKAAFYALQAGDYAEAIAHYEDLQAGEGKLPAPARARVRLAAGYALLKANRPEAARARLRQALAAAGTEAPERPRRLRLLALGLLAEAAENPVAVADLRRRRMALWRDFGGRAAELGYSEADRLAFLSKDAQQVAAAEERAGRPAAARRAIGEGLAAARAWAAQADNPAGLPVYHGLVNYLSLALRHPERFREGEPEGLGEAVSAAVAAVDQLPFVAAEERARQLRLRLLWAAYRARLHGAGPGPGAVLVGEAARDLGERRPGLLEELEALAAALPGSG